MNPAIDIGQVEGGFVFGLGWFTQETVTWDPTTGEAVNIGTWMYDPPTAYDIPEVLNVTLLEKSKNVVGVLSAKACGEPPVSLAASVVLALTDAINACLADTGNNGLPYACERLPLTVDEIATRCMVQPANYVLPSS